MKSRKDFDASREGSEQATSTSSRTGEDGDWKRIMETSSFTRLVSEKNRVVKPVLFVSLTLFTVMTILATFTTVLDGRVVGPLTWVFIYNTMLFFAAFALSLLYVMRAKRWDRLAEQARDEASTDGGRK